MGSSHSTASYSIYDNDFELVIRATKDLEFLLESEFGAPSGKTVGLHDKISHAEQRFGLSPSAVQQMRYLVTVRNKLVHDQNYNKLENRTKFAKSFDSIIQELKAKISERRGGSGNSACSIM